MSEKILPNLELESILLHEALPILTIEIKLPNITSNELKQSIKQGRKIFQVKRKDKNFQQEILTNEIQNLRPITLLENNSRMILVYLPTKTTERFDKDDKPDGEPEFENKAYFVINQDGKKTVLPFDYPILKNNYRITVLPKGYPTRWNLKDLDKYLIEKEKMKPKELYYLLNDTTKDYLDFENDYDYVYFNLWNIATYCYELFNTFPYNDYTGTKRAGKTKALTFQKLVCFNAILSGNMSGSVFFRTAEGLGCTLLLDEIEQTKNTKNEQAQTIRTLLLQRFEKESYTYRSEAKKDGEFVPTSFNLYGATSLGHIKAFDSVLEDRCIQQIMRRSKNKDLLNSEPTKRDFRFEKIRNQCYRLFLDYGLEISELQYEAKKLLSISGRELKLWTPIITMSMFFEKHGIPNLTQQMKIKSKISVEDRQQQDEQETQELKILRFIDEVILELVDEIAEQKKNPKGWIPITEIYLRLAIDDSKFAKLYDINLEYYYRTHLTQDLKRLGFKTGKKAGGYSWLITQDSIKDVKERMGMAEPQQKTL